MYEKLRSIEQEKEDAKKLSEELCEKVNLIQKSNEEKEDALANLIKEKENLAENFFHLEQQREQLKEHFADNNTEEEQEQNLSDELGIYDSRAHNVSPAFEQTNLKDHHKKYHGDT